VVNDVAALVIILLSDIHT